MGVPRREIDNGLRDGLGRLRATGGFRVDLVDEAGFLPLASPSGRIVNARRRGGGDAIRIIDGITDPGFSVAFAKIDGRYVIAR